MKIVNVNSPDTGGQCYRLSKAINETYPGIHTSRAFTKGETYRKYPVDVQWKKGWALGFPPWIKKFWETADIIHVHSFWKRADVWPKINGRAGRIMHQHGRFGRVPVKYLREQDRRAGAIRVVSSLNLIHYVDGDTDRWFPIPVDLEMLDEIKKKNQIQDGKIRIVHSPTHRGRKSTELFLSVCRELEKRHPFVETVLIENTSWLECLKIKSACDICFDQLLLQYGSSGLESMGFGQPIVAGCKDHTSLLIKEKIGYLPFIRTTRRKLIRALERLVLREDLRKKWGAIGRKYVEQWHSHKAVSEIAIRTYEEALEMRK